MYVPTYKGKSLYMAKHYSVAASYMDMVGLPKTHVQLSGFFFLQTTYLEHCRFRTE